MRPNYNNQIANMNYNEMLPARNVTTCLREVMTTRKGYV